MSSLRSIHRYRQYKYKYNFRTRFIFRVVEEFPIFVVYRLLFQFIF